MNIPKIGKNLVLLALGLCVGLILAELLAKVWLNHTDNKFCVWPPNLEILFDPAGDCFVGISGKSRFVTNSEGMRGDDYHADYRCKIITLGGSTTECLYLDQKESWPYLLQEELSREIGKPAFVGNIGMSGRSTDVTVLQLEHLIKQYDDIDIIILLVGINDLSLALAGKSYKSYNYEEPEIGLNPDGHFKILHLWPGQNTPPPYGNLIEKHPRG